MKTYKELMEKAPATPQKALALQKQAAQNEYNRRKKAPQANSDVAAARKRRLNAKPVVPSANSDVMAARKARKAREANSTPRMSASPDVAAARARRKAAEKGAEMLRQRKDKEAQFSGQTRKAPSVPSQPKKTNTSEKPIPTADKKKTPAPKPTTPKAKRGKTLGNFVKKAGVRALRAVSSGAALAAKPVKDPGMKTSTLKSSDVSGKTLR